MFVADWVLVSEFHLSSACDLISVGVNSGLSDDVPVCH